MLRIISAFFLCIISGVIYAETIYISVVNDILDNNREALGAFLVMRNNVNGIIKSNYSYEGAPPIKIDDYVNVSGSGDDNLYDQLKEVLANAQNRLSLLTAVEQAAEESLNGTDLRNRGSIIEYRDRVRAAGTDNRKVAAALMLFKGAKNSNFWSATINILFEYLPTTTVEEENTSGDTALRTERYTPLVSEGSCLILLAEEGGLVMARKVQNNLSSIADDGQVQVVPTEFDGSFSESLLRGLILDAIDVAVEKGCRFRINQVVSPENIASDTPSNYIIFWQGFPRFPVTLHAASSADCQGIDCASELNIATFDLASVVKADASNVFSYSAVCGNDKFSSTGGYFFLEDAREVTTNSVRVEGDCPAPPPLSITSVVADGDDLAINTNTSFFNPGGTLYDIEIFYEGEPDFPITVTATILPETRHLQGHCGRSDRGPQNCTVVKEIETPPPIPQQTSVVVDGFYCEGFARSEPIVQTFQYSITDANGVKSDVVEHTHECDFIF